MPDVVVSIESALHTFVNSGGSETRAALVLGRSLDILNCVLKEFASIKMPAGIRIMEQVYPLLLPEPRFSILMTLPPACRAVAPQSTRILPYAFFELSVDPKCFFD